MPDVSKKTKVVSIVGSRRCTSYGEDIAYRVAFELGKRGAIIVSGLAYGIDSCAHRGCLDAGGTTVAVLGTPIDKIYPTSNLTLARRILEKGAIISEYPPGEITKAYHFLERNRIVAGLADVVVVAEASEHSGTFRTYSVASDISGCDIYAVPGDISRPMSRGCNMMLSGCASALTSIEDLVSYLYPSGSAANRLKGLTKEEYAVAQEIVNGICQGEQIMEGACLAPQDFNRIITVLELKSIVRPLGCNRWALA